MSDGGRLKRLADRLDDWHVVRILAALSHFAIIVTLIAFVIDLMAREEDRQRYLEEKAEWQFGRLVAAWSLLTTKSAGNSGKITAINVLFGAGEDIVGVDLSCENNGGSLTETPTLPARSILTCDRGVFLSGLEIRNATTAGRTLFSDSDLSGVNLSRSRLEGLTIRSAAFVGADITGLQILNTTLDRVDFSRALGTPLDRPERPVRLLLEAPDRERHIARFTNVTFQNANLSGARLFGASFVGSEAVGIDFAGTNLGNADLGNVTFQGVRIDADTITEGVNISGATLRLLCQRRNRDHAMCKAKLAQMWAWSDRPPDVDPREDWRVWKVCPAALQTAYDERGGLGVPSGC